MGKKKEIYQTLKVIDPHVKGFPKEAKELIFEIGRDWECSNDSFFHWTVDNWDEDEEIDEEDDEINCRKLDALLIEYGCKPGDKFIILYWW